MELLNLIFSDFRNFTHKKIVFDPKLTVIVGPNGSGKSNILESIVLLSGARSHRVDTDLDLVKFAKSEAKIEGKTSGNFGVKTLAINFVVVDERYVKKAYFADSIKKRLVDFLTFLSVVVFEPQDIELVTGSPSVRRHYLDLLLSSLDKDYWRNISSYNKVVTRRNKVLVRIMEGKSNKSELDFWDARILEHGKVVTHKRGEFIDFLNFLEKGEPLAEMGNLSWEFKKSEVSQEKLTRNRERDIAAGVTLSGPHRDDFRFIYKKHDLAFFGSRGEQRMAVLALKLAELEFKSVRIGSRAILALDDIFSELDWDHRRAVLSVVNKQQTIITAAEEESVPKNLLKRANVIRLR